MIQLADDVFAVRDDPDQLDVNENVLDRLRELHPSTVSEFADSNGPVAWVLLIPTSGDLMERFLKKEISEKDLFEMTKPGINYEAIYLCSAMVLEEYRRKGIAGRLTIDAIEKISEDHPIKSLFVWTFSEEGARAADSIAQLTELPLIKR